MNEIITAAKAEKVVTPLQRDLLKEQNEKLTDLLCILTTLTEAVETLAGLKERPKKRRKIWSDDVEREYTDEEKLRLMNGEDI